MKTLAWSPTQVRDVWRWPFAATLALVLLVLLVYRDTAAAMVEIWVRSETFTHAFVVPPIVAWLIWRKRAELAPLLPRPSPWMLLPLAGLALMWWLGHAVNVAAATQLAITAMVVTTVPLVLGWQVTRVLAFPLAFAFFAVPIGEFLTPVLMHWTAEALVAGLRATGIPVYQEAQQLVIPSGRWAVVSACSGIRYLMATFMVGSLFAYLNYRSTSRRLLFIAVSIVLPVLANWVRAYIIVMLGHLSDNEIATGADHLIYGWVFFGAVVMSLFFIGARWAEDDNAAANVAAAEQKGSAATAAAAASGVPAWQPLAGVMVVAVLAVQWPAWLPTGPAGGATAAPVRLVLPATLGAWTAEPVAARAWEPYIAAASARQALTYRGPAGQVTVHVAYYRGQTGDVKLVTSANRWIEQDSPYWNMLALGNAPEALGAVAADWRSATILGAESLVGPGQDRPRLTVWQSYWIGGRLVRGDIPAKLHQAWEAVQRHPDDGAALHIVSTLPDGPAAQRQLAAFVTENFGMLQRSLTQVRDQR